MNSEHSSFSPALQLNNSIDQFILQDNNTDDPGERSPIENEERPRRYSHLDPFIKPSINDNNDNNGASDQDVIPATDPSNNQEDTEIQSEKTLINNNSNDLTSSDTTQIAVLGEEVLEIMLDQLQFDHTR